MALTDQQIRRLVQDEAGRIADERIKRALGDARYFDDRSLDARLKSSRHESSDHLDRALIARKIKPSTDGTSIRSDGGDAAWIGPEWKVLDQRVARQLIGVTANRFIAMDGGAMFAGSAAGATMAAIYINPSRLSDVSGNLGIKVKLQGWALTETDPTDSTLTVALCQVTGISAGQITAIGSDVVSASFSVTAANVGYEGVSDEADFSTSGFYTVRFQHSAAPSQTIVYGYTIYYALK